MAAVSIVSGPGLVMHEIVKRGTNWPAKNAGVMVVFCIVFVVAVGVISFYISKWIKRRKEAKPQY